jgi:hypothetical protein
VTARLAAVNLEPDVDHLASASDAGVVAQLPPYHSCGIYEMPCHD